MASGFCCLALFCPTLSTRVLPFSAASMVGWVRNHPSAPYPPLTWELAVAIAVKLAAKGRKRMAVGLLLSFDSWLRVGEMVRLEKEDFTVASDLRLGAEYSRPGLRLGKTKTGTEQWVEPLHKGVVCLTIVAQSTEPGGFSFSEAVFRREFKSACGELGLSKFYVPHSCRHGGATRAFLLGRDVRDIMARGRWKSQKSCERYVQAGRAILHTLQAPAGLAELGLLLSKNLVAAVLA
jgi:integrase